MSVTICNRSDLVANSGVCALIGEEQIALFYLPESEQKIFALSNWDPIGEANVMSRGILGSVDDRSVVASPLYKQHFCLKTGECLEEQAQLKVFPVSLNGEQVVLAAQ